MGIPYLLQLLSPYASPCHYDSNIEDDSQDRLYQVKKANERKASEKAIIDGPALAYHAYHQALGDRRGASDVLEATPRHSEVNAIGLRYLEDLKKHGFHVDVIFFDGYLPQIKRQTRFARCAAYIRDLSTFRRVHTLQVEPREAIAQRRLPKQTRVFPTKSETVAKPKGLPVVPFMVPSFLEALSQSQFSQKVHVVPGEADEYCANFAKKHGGSVFTSDSDLLVHHLGESGAVVIFKECERGETKTGTQFRVKKYKTAQIAAKLNLESLQPLAFAIQEDHYRGLGPCIQHAKRLSSRSTRELEEFMLQYSPPEQLKFGLDDGTKRALEQLDPRISEWIIQVLKHKTSQQDPGDIQISFDMFLPFLNEDPDRASAWATGSDVRKLAYSIMCPSHKPMYNTTEYARKGSRFTGQTVDYLSPSEVESTLAKWCNRWSVLSRGTSSVLSWRLMGLYSLCQQLQQAEKPLPIRPSMYALLCGKTLGPGWEFLHLSAHFQAALYSWRLLNQIMAVLLATPDSHSIMEDIGMSAVKQLHVSTPTIPQIQDLFTVTEEIKDDQMEVHITTLCELLGVQQDAIAPAKETSKSNKRRKKETKQASSNAKFKSSTPFSSSNMYNLLSSAE